MRIAFHLSSLIILACTQAQAADTLTPEREAQVLGTYAQRLVFSNISELPIVGKSRTVANSDRIVQLVKDGDAYKLLERSCRLSVVSDGPLKVSFSDRSIQALAPTVSTVTLQDSEEGLVITRPAQAEIIGAKLNAESEALPLKDSDPRVVDADQDGKPGLTATAEAGPLKGQLYIIQRSISSYEAREQEAGVFAGLLQDSTEQVVVGTSSFLLNAAKGKLALTPDPDPTQSRVLLIKAADTISCADLDAILGL